jgi:hypothetical protein
VLALVYVALLAVTWVAFVTFVPKSARTFKGT